MQIKFSISFFVVIKCIISEWHKKGSTLHIGSLLCITTIANFLLINVLIHIGLYWFMSLFIPEMLYSQKATLLQTCKHAVVSVCIVCWDSVKQSMQMSVSCGSGVLLAGISTLLLFPSSFVFSNFPLTSHSLHFTLAFGYKQS